jgi:hypothetical protein
VRGTWTATHRLLSLAEGVLRECGLRLPGEGTPHPSGLEEKQKRPEYLEKKVQTKDEVLAELMAEHVALKKVLGSFNRELNAG